MTTAPQQASEPIATADPAEDRLDPDALASLLSQGRAVLVDVREPFEHAGEHIEGARLVPLGSLDPHDLAQTLGQAHPGGLVVFHCRSGQRSAKALARCRDALSQAGLRAAHLEGGIEAWKAAGKPIGRACASPRLDVMRQVQVVAGSLVLAGVLLGAWLSPWLLAVPAFVGAGLLFAGLSGWCGMARLLAKMPWNNPPAARGSSSSAAKTG